MKLKIAYPVSDTTSVHCRSRLSIVVLSIVSSLLLLFLNIVYFSAGAIIRWNAFGKFSLNILTTNIDMVFNVMVPVSSYDHRSFLELGEFNQRLGVFYLCRFQNWHMSIYFEIDIPPNLSQPGRRQQWNLFSNQSEVVKLASTFEKSTYANFLARNWHMSIYQNEVTDADYKCSYWTKSTHMYVDFSSSWQTLHYGSDHTLYTSVGEGVPIKRFYHVGDASFGTRCQGVTPKACFSFLHFFQVILWDLLCTGPKP